MLTINDMRLVNLLSTMTVTTEDESGVRSVVVYSPPWDFTLEDAIRAQDLFQNPAA